jgi:hypothetical protein
VDISAQGFFGTGRFGTIFFDFEWIFGSLTFLTVANFNKRVHCQTNPFGMKFSPISFPQSPGR